MNDQPLADRVAPRIALVTCAQIPELDADTRRLLGPLEAAGVAAEAVVWDDPAVDWASFDLAVVRSCWDYVPRRAEFLAWAQRVPRLANPAEVLAWNTDKRYLQDLAVASIPVVPTVWVAPGQPWTPPAGGEWVLKPAVSMASLDTGRYRLGDPHQRRLAVEHLRRLQAAGRTVMVQPYLHAVDTQGETALVYLGGRSSHAIRKGPVLDGPDTGVDRRFQHDGGLQLQICRPSAMQRAVADRVLAAVPGGPSRLLYARVDLVPGLDGEPLLMELELTEPQLFLGHAPGAADRLAAAITARTRYRSRLQPEVPAAPAPAGAPRRAWIRSERPQTGDRLGYVAADPLVDPNAMAERTGMASGSGTLPPGGALAAPRAFPAEGAGRG